VTPAPELELGECATLVDLAGGVWPWPLGDEMACGSAATAQPAAASTKMPVPTAAAGRSQPSQPVRPGSGLNRSETTAKA
jgi:hypothetical protein